MKKEASILSIGTEIIEGRRLDTNSQQIALQLLRYGWRVKEITSLPDNLPLLVNKLKSVQSPLTITTGGLGPTKDDVTRFAIAKAFQRKLVSSHYWASILRKNLAAFFTPDLIEKNLVQALVPQGAKVLKNRLGTACGFYIKPKGNIVLALPGPPREMMPMLKHFLEQEHLLGRPMPFTILRTICLPESKVSEILKDIAIPGTTLYPLLFDTEVHLYLSAQTQSLCRQAERTLLQRLSPYCYGKNEVCIEEVVGKKLLAQQKTLALAESCTGGYLGKRITACPGISQSFLLGVVSYSNVAKRKLLSLSPSLLQKEGAVSKASASAMAEGVRRLSKADIGLSITGIAGPGGGTQEKPIGLTFFGISDKKEVSVRRMILPGDREHIRKRATDVALFLLWQKLK